MEEVLPLSVRAREAYLRALAERRKRREDLRMHQLQLIGPNPLLQVPGACEECVVFLENRLMERAHAGIDHAVVMCNTIPLIKARLEKTRQYEEVWQEDFDRMVNVIIGAWKRIHPDVEIVFQLQNAFSLTFKTK